jgi:hypothetical protein
MQHHNKCEHGCAAATAAANAAQLEALVLRRLNQDTNCLLPQAVGLTPKFQPAPAACAAGDGRHQTTHTEPNFAK